MMEPEDTTHTSQSQESPYAPPPIIGEATLPSGVAMAPLPPMPVAFILIYSVIATALTMFFVAAVGNVLPSDLWLLIMGSPIFAIAGFVALLFLIAGPEGQAASISMTWKVVVLVLLPPASMICFVPTCVGSTIFLMPLLEHSMNAGGMAIPIFIAYATTCFLVALRLRSRIARKLQAPEPVFRQILAPASQDSPYSMPKPSDPQ